jgi:hypothetical protein
MTRRSGRLVRLRLKRDEEYQARELTKTLSILDAEDVEGAPSSGLSPTLADPKRRPAARPGHDLDEPG